MSARLEELDWRSTPMGEISLRRRLEPSLQVDVYEVRLGDEFLMSSLFTVAEVELARLGLAAVPGTELDVLVGGLGLGYTARTVLEDPRVRSLEVVDAVAAVIDWHRRELLPLSHELVRDPRTRLVEADFFAVMAEPGPAEATTGDSDRHGQRWHAILVDIDHTPRHLLHPSHAAFYTADGLGGLASRLHPCGVFALWSDDPPDAEFLELLAGVFSDVGSHVVTFANHYTGGRSANTVYTAHRKG